MNVGRLKELLEDIDNDFEVVMSSDGEGNSFSPLADFEKHEYVANSTWSGEVIFEHDYDEDIKVVPNAIVLWPTN